MNPVFLIPLAIPLLAFLYITRYYYRDLLLGPTVDFTEDANIEIGLYPGDYKAAMVLTCDDVNPTTDPGKIKRVLEIAREYGLKVVFFAVPYYRGRETLKADSEVAKILKDAEAEGHEVALHGLTHASPTRRYLIRRFKEFGYLPYSEQRRRIRMGRRLMEQAGFQVQGFRSPGFSASWDTLMVVDAEEFAYSSDTRIYPFMLISNKRFCESIYYPYHPRGLGILDFTANGDYFWGYSRLGSGNLRSLKQRFNKFYDNRGVFVLLSHIEPINSKRGLRSLRSFLEYAKNRNLWRANLREISEWWRAREALYATTQIKGKTLLVTLEKGSEHPLHDLVIQFKHGLAAKDYKIMDVNGVVIAQGKTSEGKATIEL